MCVRQVLVQPRWRWLFVGQKNKGNQKRQYYMQVAPKLGDRPVSGHAARGLIGQPPELQVPPATSNEAPARGKVRSLEEQPGAYDLVSRPAQRWPAVAPRPMTPAKATRLQTTAASLPNAALSRVLGSIIRNEIQMYTPS
jgi:hypothetical protein